VIGANIVIVIIRLLEIYQFIIVAGALLSWFPMREGSLMSDIRAVLYRITEPYVGIFRRLIGPVALGGMYMDFSPLIALVVLQLLERVIVGILL
jgi:uncharacterized protein YggT (Ycf19 family)